MTPQIKAAEHVRNYAHEVLGLEAKAWLSTPNPRLNGKTPNELLHSFPGTVERLLMAIEGGDF